MYCDIVISNNSLFIENKYTYKVPDDIVTKNLQGKRAVVPFGNGTALGLIISIYDELHHEFLEVKEVISLIDDYPIITNDSIITLEILCRNTGNTMSRYLNSIYPITFNIQKKKLYKVEKIDNIDLILRTLLPSGEFEITSMLEEYKNDIIRHTESGNISFRDVYLRKVDVQTKEAVKLIGESKLNLTSKQKDIVDFMHNHGNEYVTIKALVNDYGFSKNIINTLIKNSVLEKKYITECNHKFDANIVQRDTQNSERKLELVQSLNEDSRIEYIRKVLDEGKSKNMNTLILFPDTTLAYSMGSKLKEYYQDDLEVFHSKMSERKKFNTLTRINNNEVRVLIGVGGAALVPITNIGQIILYESSDTRFLKSQYNFYDINFVAEMRSKINNTDLIHISSFHSISEYYKKQNDVSWVYKKLESKPDFISSIIDMKNELLSGNRQILSLSLQEKIRKRISDFEISFLLVNSRNNNSSLKCRGCGKSISCPHCGTNLKLSDKTKKLSCTSCDFEIDFVGKCIYCGSDKVRKMKLGIEDVNNFVRDNFGNVSVLMLTMEDLTSISRVNQIISDINQKKYDIIIGTRDVATIIPKNKISLVALVMIDITLNINTYRASELAFNEILTAISIISQNPTNELLIQTYDPNNKIIKYALNNMYEEYYNDELVYRKISNNPPYSEITYLKIRLQKTSYRRLIQSINLYVGKYFKEGSYFGPNIENTSSSGMTELKYTIKVNDIEEVIKFMYVLKEAFSSDSMYITIEHE